MSKLGKNPYDGSLLHNLTCFKREFNDAIAREYEKMKDENNIYLISDIRNTTYQKKASAETSSRIIDSDTYNQLSWCNILKPKYALLKYRAKLPFECVTFHEKLTDASDSDEKRKLYYKYPKGIFLKIPYQKKNQKGMYFFTNDYSQTEKYYHHDMISAVDLHNGYTRRSVIYENPSGGNFFLNRAVFTLTHVKELIERQKGQEKARENLKEYGYDETSGTGWNAIDKEEKMWEYCFGCGWDSRAAVHITITLMKYLDLYISKSDIEGHLASYLVFPYMYMRELESGGVSKNENENKD